MVNFLSAFYQTIASILTTKGDLLSFSTTEIRLPVGSNGEILSANSSETTGLEWVVAPADAVMTTKGDLVGFTTVRARLAVGSNDEVVLASSGDAIGVKWGTLVNASITDDTIALTKIVQGTLGELIGTDGTTRQLLAVGANDTVLTASSGETTGLKWGSPTFESLYSVFNPETTIAKQRFVDFCTGALFQNRYWVLTDITGTGSVSMVDAVDEGMTVTSGANSGDNSELDFNNIKPFDDSACVGIFVARRVDNANGRYDIGFQDGTDNAYCRNNNIGSFYAMICSDGVCTTNTDSDLATDEAFHVIRIDMKASSATMTIDGALKLFQSLSTYLHQTL